MSETFRNRVLVALPFGDFDRQQIADAIEKLHNEAVAEAAEKYRRSLAWLMARPGVKPYRAATGQMCCHWCPGFWPELHPTEAHDMTCPYNTARALLADSAEPKVTEHLAPPAPCGTLPVGGLAEAAHNAGAEVKVVHPDCKGGPRE